MQGAGWLTLEDLRWDETRRPDAAAGSRPRRRAPTSCRASPRCPTIFNVALLEQRHRGRRRLRLQGRRRAAADAGVLACARRCARRARRSGRPAPASTSPRRRPPRRCTGRSSRRGRRRRRRTSTRAPRAGADQPARRRAAAARVRALRRSVACGGLTCTGWPRSSGCGSRASPGCWSRSPTVRGHAPREAGAKMVVAADATWGSIGGGNLEAVAVARARELLARARRRAGDVRPSRLSDKAPVRARRAVLRRRGDGPARAAAGRAGGGDLRRRARRPGAGPHPRPATTSTCTWSTPGPSSSAAERARGRSPTRGAGARPPRCPVLPELVLARAAARHPRAGHDPRPRRGRRAVRRRPALSPTSARSG